MIKQTTMKATAKTLEQISLFEDRLLLAFSKMIRGINIELTDETKEKYKGTDLVVYDDFFIVSIYEDESINVINRNGQIKNLTLSDIKLYN